MLQGGNNGMKRILLLNILPFLLAMNTYAADIPAEMDYLNIISNEDLHYITENGNIALLKNTKTNIVYHSIADVYSSPLIDGGLFFENVKAFAESYDLTQYYYIDKNGDLYQYNIGSNMNKTKKIDGISNCIKVCCGNNFMIALLNDGTVWAWGENDFGQLANGNYETNYTPSKILYLSDIIDITAGDGYAFAVDCNGFIYSWGKHKSVSDSSDEYNTQYIGNCIPQKTDIIKDCIRVDTAGNETAWIMTADGNLYQFYSSSTTAFKTEEIKNCIDMSMQPWANLVYSPIVLTSDGSTWHWAFSSGSVDGWPNDEFTKTTYIADLVKVVAGVKNTYIKSDGSIWFVKPDEKEYWDQGDAVCVVGPENENKLSMSGIKFVKRSEMAEQLMELYEDLTDETSITSSGCTYKDVDADSKYIEDIGKCCSLGLMNGTDAESFSPNKVLRREQLAVILDRLFSLTNTKCTSRTEAYADDSEISEWAKESVYKTASLFETSDGSYDPQEYVSYDELESVFEKVKSL